VLANESRDAFRAWFERVRRDWLPFATILEGRVVGSSSYGNVRERDRVVEIGNTWVAPDAWGSGANTEAKYLMLRHAIEDEGFQRVEFKTEATNERSRAALAAFAELEGVFRKHMVVRHGERRDSAWYAVIEDDWPEAKALLERRLYA
jgi:RimJ/RimL family protein N-acetyltransferase